MTGEVGGRAAAVELVELGSEDPSDATTDFVGGHGLGLPFSSSTGNQRIRSACAPMAVLRQRRTSAL